MAIFHNIIQSGVDRTELHSEKRNIVLSNYVSIVMAFAISILIISRISLNNISEIGLLRLLIGFLIFLLPIPLNRFGLIRISRLALCWLPSLYIITISIALFKSSGNFQISSSSYTGVRFYLLALSCFPFLVFNLKNTKFFLLGLLGPAVPLLFYDPILNFYKAGYFQNGLNESDYSFNNVRVFISMLIIGLSCFFLKRLIEQGEELNDKLIKELVEKNAKIAEQNIDLKEHQEELNAINQNLEELVNNRTEKIRLKNEQIIKYAFTNAHKVRGPLARILGLIEVSNMESDLDYKFLFKKIQNEARDLDCIVHEINTELDKNID